MQLIKVLVVDDSVVSRRLISRALEREAGIEIVGTAVNGSNAIKKVELLGPDIIVMDMEMPEMDGIEALQRLKRSHPQIPVIMFSAMDEMGSERMIQALELGAEDFVTKPVNTPGSGHEEQLEGIRASLLPKIEALCARLERKQTLEARGSSKPAGVVQKRKKRHTSSRHDPVEIVAIGVSTGGPNALATLIPAISPSIPVPVVIVQHMPKTFTKALANRLDAHASISVCEGQDGMLLSPGHVYIAPGGYHMTVEKKGHHIFLRMNMDPPEQGCRPAVDVLFRSVAQVYGKSTLAVILTGMGKDGLSGSEKIVRAGGTLYAQDEVSSVVWGMPGAVTKAGLVDKVVPLDRMSYEIMLRTEMASVNLADSN